MIQYLVNITNDGVRESTPSQFVLFLYDGYVYINSLKGRAIYPEEIPPLFRHEELRELKRKIEENAKPVIITKRVGTSGCTDYFIRDITETVYKKTFSIHVSMFEKLNNGFKVPLWGACSAINLLNDVYGYAKRVRIEVKETNIIIENDMIPLEPYRGVDEKPTEEELNELLKEI